MIGMKPMRTRFSIFLPLMLALGGIPLSRAATPDSCSGEVNTRAESLLINARDSWPALLKHQRAFAFCDDGSLGEGYSEAVVALLAKRWEQFDRFASLANKDPSFRRWAIRHIDASASDDDLNKIISNASSCMKKGKEKVLCTAIRQAATRALAESVKLRRQSGS